MQMLTFLLQGHAPGVAVFERDWDKRGYDGRCAQAGLRDYPVRIDY
jgi:hypothetical protein